MTVIYTEPARADLDEIIAYTRLHFPNQLSALEDRVTAVVARIERYPKSAVAMVARRNVRVVPLGRFPFRIFYREIPDGVEILHVRHTARKSP